MTKSLLAECIDIIKDMVGHEYLYFNDGIEIKPGPHIHVFTIWGVACSPRNELFIMDNNEEWHRIDLNDLHAQLIIGSIYQRIKLLRINYAKAS
ncbi:MAG TPA: hypothetical protein VGO09_00155 [Flavisolibacter sp.]|nr:hypothetical protein [Flavisolibacter sp.]